MFLLEVSPNDVSTAQSFRQVSRVWEGGVVATWVEVVCPSVMPPLGEWSSIVEGRECQMKGGRCKITWNKNVSRRNVQKQSLIFLS